MEKNVSVSARFASPNTAERALDHLVQAGFGKTAAVSRLLADGAVELVVHCDSTEQMDAAKQVFEATAGQHIDARTENERVFEE